MLSRLPNLFCECYPAIYLFVNMFLPEGIDLEYHLKVISVCNVLASHCIWFIAYDRETKSGLSCLHKLKFNGHLQMLHYPWRLRHIQDSGLTWLLWVLLGYSIWHLLKLLKSNLQGLPPCKKSI